MATVWALNATVVGSAAASCSCRASSYRTLRSRKPRHSRMNNNPCCEMLSWSHFSRLRYSLRDARAATSRTMLIGARTSSKCSSILRS